MPRFSLRRLALALALAIALLAACGVAAHADDFPYPGSCQDIHNQNPYARDGNYVLYNNGNLFTVFCYDMTGTPREYIDLAAKGTDVNFSQYTAGGASPGTNVRTTFTKLRIDPATLTVDIGDLTFATSTGSLLHGGISVTSMPYGTAMSCTSPQSADGVGNIDLRGTPFQVNNTFDVGGFEAAGSATVSSHDQLVTLSGGGYCGWITPSPAMYNPFNPSPGNYHLKLSCANGLLMLGRYQFCLHVG
jgi:GON domain